MATWPANTETDWNTKMLAYLAIEHNTDGTHAIKWPINGTDTRIFTKYFTGTLDSDADTDVAHGVTAANILAVDVIVGTATVFAVMERFLESSPATEATDGANVIYDATNIKFFAIGTNYQGQAYRIKIDYIA